MSRILLSRIGRYAGLSAVGSLFSYRVYMDAGKPYSWGWNNFGQLGLGHAANQQTPQLVHALDSTQVIQVCGSANSSAAVTLDGKVYTWGKSKNGVLGHPSVSENNLNIPTLVESLAGHHIKFISCGQNHMAAINDKGELLTWGSPQHGKLGHSLKSVDDQVKKDHYYTNSNFNNGIYPKKVEIGKSIIQVACGNQHTVCVTSDGEVYSWGLNKKGLLGTKTEEQDVMKPQKLDLPEKFVKVDAGADFTIALSESGKLYAWGSNYFGQLGAPNVLYVEKPLIIGGFNQKIKDFSCGEQFVGAIDIDGKLYTWGYGGDGQLGHPNKQDVPVPRVVEFQHSIKYISCGIGHVGLITMNDQLFVFGRGKEGQLGRGSEIESPNSYRLQPQQVEMFKNSKVIQIACGGSHTLALVH